MREEALGCKKGAQAQITEERWAKESPKAKPMVAGFNLG